MKRDCQCNYQSGYQGSLHKGKNLSPSPDALLWRQNMNGIKVLLSAILTGWAESHQVRGFTAPASTIWGLNKNEL